MEIAAFASFLVLVIAWLMLPLRATSATSAAPAVMVATREEPLEATVIEAASAAA